VTPTAFCVYRDGSNFIDSPAMSGSTSKELFMRKALVTSTLLLCTGLLVWAAPLLFEKKGESSIRQIKNSSNLVETTIHTQDYQLLHFYSGDGNVETRLLDIRKDNTTYENAEGVRGHIQLILSKTGQQKFDTPVWKISEDGTDWAYVYDPELIVTLMSGCCGAMDGARAYNIDTGKLIMSYTPMIQEVGASASPFSIEVPNTKLHRLIGVITADSSRDFPPEVGGRDSSGYQPAGIVKYADKNSLLQKLLIKVKVPENYGTSIAEAQWVAAGHSRNELRAGKVTLWEADGRENAAGIGGVSLELKVFGEQEYKVVIPVLNDRFDISRSQIPEGITIVPLQ
jgi:hypothetical protein